MSLPEQRPWNQSDRVEPLLVAGIGSPHGDDRAGWRVIQQLDALLAEASREDARGIELRCANSPADLLDWANGRDELLICDACLGLGEPGDIHRWVWPLDVPDVRRAGTHDFSLVASLQLLERLGQLPSRVVLYGISASPNSGCPDGGDLHPRVAAAAAEVALRILKHASSP